jgi:hypothetical protein
LSGDNADFLSVCERALLLKPTMKIKMTAIVGRLLLWAPFVTTQEKTRIRFGHFPNITHAQGVIGHALSRQGKGWFEERLEPGVKFNGLRTTRCARSGIVQSASRRVGYQEYLSAEDQEYAAAALTELDSRFGY